MSTNSSKYGLFYSSDYYTPEGRLNQIENAANATLNSGTAIGLTGIDGMVLAVENIVIEPLSQQSSRTFTIDEHIGAVVAGLQADSRNIVNAAREKANYFRNTYGSPAPLSEVERSVSEYMHSHTQTSDVRPFGASMILGSYIPDGPKLYVIEPSGESYSYFGCAIGKAADAATLVMEDSDFQNKPIVELVKFAAEVIYEVHEGEDGFELELSWCSEETNGRHVLVPPNVREEAVDHAKEMTSIFNSSDSDEIF